MFTRLKTLLNILRYFWPDSYPVDLYLARRKKFIEQIKKHNQE